MTAPAGRHIAHVHALADAAQKEAASAARHARGAGADLLGILAGPPAKPGGVARVAAPFGLVVIPDAEAEAS